MAESFAEVVVILEMCNRKHPESIVWELHFEVYQLLRVASARIYFRKKFCQDIYDGCVAEANVMRVSI